MSPTSQLFKADINGLVPPRQVSKLSQHNLHQSTMPPKVSAESAGRRGKGSVAVGSNHPANIAAAKKKGREKHSAQYIVVVSVVISYVSSNIFVGHLRTNPVSIMTTPFLFVQRLVIRGGLHHHPASICSPVWTIRTARTSACVPWNYRLAALGWR